MAGFYAAQQQGYLKVPLRGLRQQITVSSDAKLVLVVVVDEDGYEQSLVIRRQPGLVTVESLKDMKGLTAHLIF
jgi:hypothetical protein